MHKGPGTPGGDARLRAGPGAEAGEHRVGTVERGHQTRRIGGREVVHDDAYRRVGQSPGIPNHRRHPMARGDGLAEELATDTTGRRHNREPHPALPRRARADPPGSTVLGARRRSRRYRRYGSLIQPTVTRPTLSNTFNYPARAPP